jgi:hypothetical protein
MDRNYEGYGAATQAAKLNQPAQPVAQDSILGRLNQLSEVSSRLSAVAGAAEKMADRIAGMRPEKEEGGKPSPVANGLSEQLAEIIDSISVRIHRIELAHQRIDAAVG